VLLAGNNHMEMMSKGQMAKTTFAYRSASPLPPLTAYKAAGKPSITILSPADGATVGESFPVELDWTNFTPSCNLLGKKNLIGNGHWHLNIDTMMGPMMGMGTMLTMGCTHTYTAFTDGLRPGKHRLYALLVDNQHAPLMPNVASMITVNVVATTSPSVAAEQMATIVNDAQTVGRYVPGTLHLKVGQSVIFKNVSDAAHTVTSDNGAFDSGNIAQGASWRFTATKAGTFPYHCIYHSLMRGTIIVSS
jgi:plastocyanin